MADLDQPIEFAPIGDADPSSFIELPPADADGFEAASNARFAQVDQKLSELQMGEKADLKKITSWFHRANQKLTARPSSLLGRGVFGKTVDDKLQRFEDDTKAELRKLDRDEKEAEASSFLEEDAPDSFADLDAKLKALEEKTKAELAKLQSDTAAPSSFLELPAEKAMSFSDLDAKFAAMEDSQKREMA